MKETIRITKKITECALLVRIPREILIQFRKKCLELQVSQKDMVNIFIKRFLLDQD